MTWVGHWRQSALTGNLAALIGATVSVTLATLLVARVGGPPAIGDYALLRVMPWLLATLVSGGLSGATAYFLAGPTRDDRRVKLTILSIAAAAAIASLVVWVAASPFLQSLFFRDLTAALVAWAGLKTISRLLVITAKAASQGTGDLPGSNRAILLEELLFLPAYAACLLLGLGNGAAIVAGLVAADVGTAALAWRRLFLRGYFVTAAPPSLALARRIYAFGWRGQAGNIMSLVNLRLDFMIVAILAGPVVLGIYAIASKFSETLRLLPIAFNWVLYPRFARDGTKQARRHAASILPRAAAATAVAAVPLAVLAGPVIPLLYGSAFADAVLPARLLLIGLSVEGAAGVISAYLFGQGRPGLNSMAIFGGVVVTVGLDLMLIPRLSLIGAAIASTLAYLTTTSLLLACFFATRQPQADPILQVGKAVRPGAVRRVVDVVAASLGLVVLSPVLLASWLAAGISTGASGIYRQVRVGEGGIPFTMLKFRSMRPGREAGDVTAVDDPRVTRFGSILRATSIDELPQLINVLFGDMTLVGARPETVSLALRYPPQLQAVFRHRPGLTGPGQLMVRGHALLGQVDDIEAAYIAEIVPIRVALDLDYLAEPSFRRTLALIVSTAANVLIGIAPQARAFTAPPPGTQAFDNTPVHASHSQGDPAQIA